MVINDDAAAEEASLLAALAGMDDDAARAEEELASQIRALPAGGLGAGGDDVAAIERAVAALDGGDDEEAGLLKQLELVGDGDDDEAEVRATISHTHQSEPIHSTHTLRTPSDADRASLRDRSQILRALEGMGVADEGPKESAAATRERVLALKREALRLKREGKLDEARAALRDAKALQASLDGAAPTTSSPAPSASASAATAIVGEDPEAGGRVMEDVAARYRMLALQHRRAGDMAQARHYLRLSKGLPSDAPESEAPTMASPTIPPPSEDVRLGGTEREHGEEGGPPPLGVVDADGPPQSIEERVRALKVEAVRMKRAGHMEEAREALRQAKHLQASAAS